MQAIGFIGLMVCNQPFSLRKARQIMACTPPAEGMVISTIPFEKR